jgi:serine/threonine protein phosphatase 1
MATRGSTNPSPATPAKSERFATLKRVGRVWAIGAVRGQARALAELYDDIAQRIEPGDRIVHLGNLLGQGPDAAGVLDELVAFRRDFIAAPGFFAADFVMLRGAQEEMWQKTLQLHFAVNPREILSWMLARGLEATLMSYGLDPREGVQACGAGATAIARWTAKLRAAMEGKGGHRDAMLALRRAAHDDHGRLLFVSAGLDIARPLAAQGDALWWGGPDFARIDAPFEGFDRIVRGLAPEKTRGEDGPYTLTLCGDSPAEIVAACVTGRGEIVEMLKTGG